MKSPILPVHLPQSVLSSRPRVLGSRRGWQADSPSPWGLGIVLSASMPAASRTERIVDAPSRRIQAEQGRGGEGAHPVPLPPTASPRFTLRRRVLTSGRSAVAWQAVAPVGDVTGDTDKGLTYAVAVALTRQRRRRRCRRRFPEGRQVGAAERLGAATELLLSGRR